MTDADIIEAFEERCGVMQYDGGLPMRNAESAALRDIVARYGQAAGRVANAHAVERRAREGRQ